MDFIFKDISLTCRIKNYTCIDYFIRFEMIETADSEEYSFVTNFIKRGLLLKTLIALRLIQYSDVISMITCHIH